MHSRRKENFNILHSIFEKYDQYFHLPYTLEQADTSWFGFLLTVKDGAPFEKNDLIDYLESCKIQTRSYFTGNALFHPAYSDLEVFKSYTDPDTQFPVATKTTKDTFFLGVFPGITKEQMDYIGRCVDNFFANL
jgi:CDP-6-deoxy-D-xylo-4-hexulose-3-dehydrase